MKKIFLSISIFILFIILSPIASAATPELLFSDLTDGTVTGWNGGNQKGAAVSIWGYGFGSSRGSSYVTVGGVNLTDNSDYAEWGATTNPTTANGQERITFWLKPSMTLGDTTITVTTSEGTSTSIPFYTRNTGNIYFVSPSGNDSNTGLNDSNQMLASFPKARDMAHAGDVVYFRDGYWNAKDPASTGDTDAVLALVFTNFNNGTLHNSITFAGYPAEAPRVGDGTGSIRQRFLIRLENENDPGTRYWTFSKLTLNRYDNTFKWDATPDLKDLNFRIVGNDMSSTENIPTHGHLVSLHGNLTNLNILGNYMHGAGKVNDTDAPTTKTKAIYFAGEGQSDGVTIAYNEIAYCNGHTQFFGHERVDTLRNLVFHDNFIHDQGQNSVVFCGGDPTADPWYKFCIGPVKVYNNVIANTINNDGGGGVIKFSAGANGNGGDFQIYNNTFYHTGQVTSWITDSFNYHDNIVIRRDGAWRQYFTQSNAGYENNGSTPTPNEVGNHNVWFNSSAAVPTWSSNDVTIATKDQFVVANPTTYQDFRIKDTSPLHGQNIGARILGGQSQNNHRADVNNSGTINIFDANLTFQKALGLDMSGTGWINNTNTGDANCNNSTNIFDANLIFKHSLGLDVSGEGWCVN